MKALVRYEAARNALAEAYRVDEVKEIRDKAEAMAAYARQAKDLDLIKWATEIKVRAERKAGEMLLSMEKNKGGDARKYTPSHDGTGVADKGPPTLADLGIHRNDSHRWQQLAGMSEDHFEAAVETAKETAGQVTTAYMLREAKKELAETKPTKKKHRKVSGKVSKADKKRLKELEDASARGVSMLSSYVRLTLAALRMQTAFTDDERLLLAELADAINQVSERTN